MHTEETYDVGIDPAFQCNAEDLLLSALHHVGDAIAFRRVNGDESSWIEQVTDLLTSHPDPFVRAQLAERCSLRQLRRLVTDEHVSVRLLSVTNPFAIDLDIQLMLAEDPDELVVHAFLDRHTPYRETVLKLIKCEHTSVRYRLASTNLANDLLSQIAHDHDSSVAKVARFTLANRYRKVAARSEVHHG